MEARKFFGGDKMRTYEDVVAEVEKRAGNNYGISTAKYEADEGCLYMASIRVDGITKGVITTAGMSVALRQARDLILNGDEAHTIQELKTKSFDDVIAWLENNQ